MPATPRQSIIDIVALSPGISAQELAPLLNAPYSQVSHIVTDMTVIGQLHRKHTPDPRVGTNRLTGRYRYFVPKPDLTVKPAVATPTVATMREQLMASASKLTQDPLDVLTGMSIKDIKTLHAALNEVFA